MTQVQSVDVTAEFKKVRKTLRNMGMDSWPARRQISSMLKASTGDLASEVAIVHDTFHVLLEAHEYNKGVVRTILSDLDTYCAPSSFLRDEFIESGSATLGAFVARDEFTGKLLAKDLRAACRDDAALLAKVEQRIAEVLPH